MKSLRLLSLVFLFSLGSAQAQTNGIFADFSTSMGEFTVFLDHEAAPRAVASFVGLATGDSSWADETGNVWMDRPFYDGSLIHRVVKDPQTNGIAIQGGGIPYPSLTYDFLPDGPAETDFQYGYFYTTNPPGVTTNNFLGSGVPFTTLNAAALPTNYTYGAETVQTNAPALTRSVIDLQAWSSNATTFVQDFYGEETWYTNHTLMEVETTNVATIFTVTTNLGATPEVLLHFVSLNWAATNHVWIPRANTNFANAGYYMLDETTNGLTHSNGVISMANSGPNTDGSQFFIMATNASYWDGSYTVFGHVTTGLNVVTSIAAVAVGGDDRPIGDVVVSTVTIRRVGVEAESFNIASQRVPVVESGPVGVVRTDAVMRVDVEIPPYSEILFRTSTNVLQSWQVEDWGYQTNDATRFQQITTHAERMAFFHSSCVQYPDAWTAPTSHVGYTFNFVWENASPETFYDVQFSSDTNLPNTWSKMQGTNSASGQLFGFPYLPQWTHFPYSAKLFFADNLGQYSYSLWFDPGRMTNRFTGVWTEWGGAKRGLMGVFTVTEP
jgi:cyclophilin family peptidyl-prolyl cis-trans isomerase